MKLTNNKRDTTRYALNLNWDIKLQFIFISISCIHILYVDVDECASKRLRNNYAINHFVLFSTIPTLFTIHIVLMQFFSIPDLQFPIDLSCVEKDHPFLEKVSHSYWLVCTSSFHSFLFNIGSVTSTLSATRHSQSIGHTALWWTA